MPLWSFQGAREPVVRLAQRGSRLEGGLSKLNSVVDVEVDVILGEPRFRTDPTIGPIETGSAPTEARAPDSLERR
jgi:hypothetical protein